MDVTEIVRFRKNHNLTQEQFGELIGASKNTVYNYENGSVIPESKKVIIERVLKSEYGEVYNAKSEARDATVNYEFKGSPYYDVDFVGGFDLALEDNRINPEYYISLPPYNKPDILWCNLYGKSMEPYIFSGDRIAIKEIQIEDVIFGKTYGIITHAGLRTVKWIVRSPIDGCYRLVPENKDPKFGDYQDIRIDEIFKAFIVMGAVRAF